MGGRERFSNYFYFKSIYYVKMAFFLFSGSRHSYLFPFLSFFGGIILDVARFIYLLLVLLLFPCIYPSVFTVLFMVSYCCCNGYGLLFIIPYCQIYPRYCTVLVQIYSLL